MRFLYPPIKLDTNEMVRVAINDHDYVLVTERLANEIHSMAKIEAVKVVFRACFATNVNDSTRDLFLREALDVVNMILTQTVKG